MRKTGFNKEETGSTMAEFAIVAGVFFMMIFAIVEFSRLLYTHNALTDAARRGARYAVLHAENAPCVRNVVIYGETNIDPNTCAPSGAPLINGLTTANVVVSYQGAPSTPYGMNLGTASVSIQNYPFTLSIPFFARTLTMPAYTSTLTSESAGTKPADL